MREPLFGRERLCAVVAAGTAREAMRQISAALASTKTVELRLDWLINLAEARKLLAALKRDGFKRKATLIATCRRQEAGGKFSGDAVAQLSLLREAILAGCRWVDVELEMVESVPSFTLDLYTASAWRIISFHDFASLPKPKSLRRIADRMERLCADRGFDAIKIAAECASFRDGLRLLELAWHRRNVITVPMGDAVAPLRILALREGSILSYAPVEQETAPGQIPLRKLAGFYRGGNLCRRTRVYGVIGNPIAHSLSPPLHNAGFRARKTDAVYLPFQVADLRDFLGAVRALGIAGFSVTLPHKQGIMRYLDGCDALASSMGAVNTVVVRENGKLFGYNTDSAGLLRALEGKLQIGGSRMLIMGAGGAARAAAFTLKRAGASVFICSRRIEKAEQLARAADATVVRRDALRQTFFDAIINATPVGMHPRVNESPLIASELNCSLAFDIVYRPRWTKFLRLAAQRGIETVSGLEMFLAQGVAQWELWTGKRAPVTAMRRAAIVALRRDERDTEKKK